MKKEVDRIVFLGTGGGRRILHSQERKTGGIYFKMGKTRFILDPGPGSLVYSQKLKLTSKLNGIVLSHLHGDHSSDADVLLDGLEKPFLVAERHCLVPSKNYYPCVSKLHQQKAKKYVMIAGKRVKIRGLSIRGVKADHYVPTLGFVIKGAKTIGYPCDGRYYKGQGKNYENCDVLILNIIIPHGKRLPLKKYMSVDQAIKLVNEIKNKPRLVIITHFSNWMLDHNVDKQVKFIQKHTGVKTIAARDFMEIRLANL